MNTPDRTEAFDRIYAEGGWGGRGSGGGSDPDGAKPYVDFVLSYLDKNPVTSVVDVGCGDWRMWPDGAFAAGPKYTGLDISASVVAENQRKHGNDYRSFLTADAVDADLPDADLLICKEVIQHLPTQDVRSFLRRAVSQYPRVLICADTRMVSASALRRVARRLLPARFGKVHVVNSDITPGQYRPVDLERPPFDTFGFRRVAQYEHVTGGRTLTTKTIWEHVR